MYYLGIDGGGSQTRALLSDASGRILGRGLSGPSNPRFTTTQELRTHLMGAIRQACSETDPSQIRAAHLGLAGAGEAALHEKPSRIVREYLSDPSTHISVGHDLETALEGGLAGAPGLVLVAGTGSACYGRSDSGQVAECGGWGDLVDDAGSGSWLGLRALQACVRQADGRQPKSALLGEVMAFLDIDSMAAFKTRVHDNGLARQERARLAPIIIELAAAGDTAAGQIVAEAAGELCLLATCTARQLGLSGPPILFCGGLSKHSFFRTALAQALETAGTDSKIRRPRLPAVAGAVLLALKSAGVPTGEDTISQLSSTRD